jgi:uridine phosphorylase
MPFPKFAGKHAHDAFFTPHDLVAYHRRMGRLPEDLGLAGMIFCYQRGFACRALSHRQAEPQPALPAEPFILRDTPRPIGVCLGFGIGAPAASSLMELYIALGVTRFASIGTAGALQKSLAIGDIVLCDRAIRDEGVSHHYLPDTMFITPAPALTGRLTAALTQAGAAPIPGTTWTIDAPYRETVAEARHYQAEGVLTIDMEAAALFAVAQVRGVQAAVAFVISDSLADLVWDPQFESATVETGFQTLFTAAQNALLAE